MKQIELNKLEGDKLRAYLHGLLSFASKIALYANSPIFEVKKLLQKNMYTNHSQLHNIVLQWIDNEMLNLYFNLVNFYMCYMYPKIMTKIII